MSHTEIFKWLAVLNNNGAWRLMKTRYDRQVGDRVIVEKESYIVIAEGSRWDCQEILNATLSRRRDLLREGKLLILPSAVTIERPLL